MQSEIQQAYDMSNSYLDKLELSNKQYIKALERKGEAEINLDSMTAFVTREYDNGDYSKTALPNAVKGDKRVLDCKAELIRSDINLKAKVALVKFLTQKHDLERKRMSAEMEECKRIDYNK